MSTPMSENSTAESEEQVVVVGPDGNVLRHWKKVPKAEDHPRQVLEYLRKAR